MCVFAMTAATAQVNSVCIVGEAAGGWGDDVAEYQLTKIDADNWEIKDVVLKTGPGKLRANGGWFGDGFEWAGAFPTATGTKNGNIDIIAGTYTVTLNTATNIYNFASAAPLPVVKLVGTAVDGGTVNIPATSATTFEATLNLLNGTAQFDADGLLVSDGTLIGSAFEGGPVIPITAGEWVIKFNFETFEYSFSVPPVPTIAIVGAGVELDGWPGQANNNGPADKYQLTTTDNGVTYTINGLVCVGGQAKFRQNNGWSVNWGDVADAANGNPDGNIVLEAGTYDVTFMPKADNSNGGKGTWTFRTAGTSTVVKTNDPALLSTKGFSTANFKVSPNPTTNNWNFTTANDSIESIQILDVLGKNVMSISPRSNTANIDASSLTRGIYFAKVATAKATQTLKLMKN
ncbi:T9SS type A sorting domain-containing protein [Flavobacterium myungsuense]